MADITGQMVGTRRRGGSYDQGQIQLNDVYEQIVAQGMPRGAALTIQGKSWATMTTSAVAGLVVRPSTVCLFELWNGYSGANAPSLIVDRVFFFNLVSTNVIEGFSGWAQVTAAKATPSSAGLAIRGNSGKAYNGSAVTAVGTTVIDSGWIPWTNAYQKGAGGVVPFGATIGEVDGRLVVPPGSSLCTHVVSSLVGQTFTTGASWYEEVVTLA